jgi:hypothetical protein
MYTFHSGCTENAGERDRRREIDLSVGWPTDGTNTRGAARRGATRRGTRARDARGHKRVTPYKIRDPADDDHNDDDDDDDSGEDNGEDSGGCDFKYSRRFATTRDT